MDLLQGGGILVKPAMRKKRSVGVAEMMEKRREEERRLKLEEKKEEMRA